MPLLVGIKEGYENFTEEEVNSAREQGVVIVSLGELVLRAETASLYMLSSINYEIQEG